MSPQDELGGLKFVVFSGDSSMESSESLMVNMKRLTMIYKLLKRMIYLSDKHDVMNSTLRLCASA